MLLLLLRYYYYYEPQHHHNEISERELQNSSTTKYNDMTNIFKSEDTHSLLSFVQKKCAFNWGRFDHRLFSCEMKQTAGVNKLNGISSASVSFIHVRHSSLNSLGPRRLSSLPWRDDLWTADFFYQSPSKNHSKNHLLVSITFWSIKRISRYSTPTQSG